MAQIEKSLLTHNNTTTTTNNNNNTAEHFATVWGSLTLCFNAWQVVCQEIHRQELTPHPGANEYLSHASSPHTAFKHFRGAFSPPNLSFHKASPLQRQSTIQSMSQTSLLITVNLCYKPRTHNKFFFRGGLNLIPPPSPTFLYFSIWCMTL